MSGIVSGVLVAAIGFYATIIFAKRSRDAEQADKDRNVVALELQTVEKFFPRLQSTNETEKRAALEAISALGNVQLATKLAQAFGGPGSRAALTQIVATGKTSSSGARSALTELYKTFSGSVGAVEVDFRDENGSARQDRGTCVVIAKDGYALTAAHLFEVSVRGELQVWVTFGTAAEKHKAQVVNLDRDIDLVLIKVESITPDFAVTIGESLPVGISVTILGYPGGQALTVTAAIVRSTGQANGRIDLDAALAPRSSGSPIFNADGAVTGIIIGGRIDFPGSFGVPIQYARPLLEMAAVK